MNYCIVVHSQIPKYLQNRLQRLQNCAAGYVIGKYANTLHVINPNWLPVAENTEFNVSKLTYEGLHDKNWPEYLSVKLINRRRNLRSEKSRLTMVKRIIFSNILMKLPTNIRICENKIFLSIRLDVFIRIKPWLSPCLYKVFFYFSFHMFYLRFSFNYSILVSVVEHVEIFMF